MLAASFLVVAYRIFIAVADTLNRGEYILLGNPWPIVRLGAARFLTTTVLLGVCAAGLYGLIGGIATPLPLATALIYVAATLLPVFVGLLVYVQRSCFSILVSEPITLALTTDEEERQRLDSQIMRRTSATELPRNTLVILIFCAFSMPVLGVSLGGSISPLAAALSLTLAALFLANTFANLFEWKHYVNQMWPCKFCLTGYLFFPLFPAYKRANALENFSSYPPYYPIDDACIGDNEIEAVSSSSRRV